MSLEHDLQVAVSAHVHQLPESTEVTVHVVVVSANLKPNRVTKFPLRYVLSVLSLAWKLSLSTRANELHAAEVHCLVRVVSGVRGAYDTQILVVVTIEQVEHKRVFVHVRRACSEALEHLF